jgi:DNA-binding transcriptional MerR regulator
MRAQLRIGEVAALLGVTPKAIRHYQRVGLLGEPARSPAGYRLYGARELERLLRVRRLQAMGLSLAQIRQVLGGPQQDRSLREVLEQLLATCSAQIRALEARRERIQALLAAGPVDADALDQPAATPGMLAWARVELEQRGYDLSSVSSDVWEQDSRLFGLLESFSWPEGYQETLRETVRQVIDEPERYRALVQLGERLAGMATVSADSPEIERRVEVVVRSGVAQLLAPAPAELAATPAPPADSFGAVLRELLLGALSPAQQRFLQLVRAQLGDGG